MIVLAFAFGCLAAVANAATNVMQRSANRDESGRLQFSLQLIKNLLRKPLWLASIATMLASFVLQAAGLGLGTLAAIEPLLVLELPLTLIGARVFLGARLGRREQMAIAAMTAATIGLIAFLGPSGGRGTGIGWLAWLTAVAATAVPIGITFWLGRRARSPGRRAGLLGIGAGLSFGFAAGLTKGMTEQFSSGGVTGVLTSWQLYGAAAAGLLAFWMDQNAMNAGRLAAAQPGITLGDPWWRSRGASRYSTRACAAGAGWPALSAVGRRWPWVPSSWRGRPRPRGHRRPARRPGYEGGSARTLRNAMENG